LYYTIFSSKMVQIFHIKKLNNLFFDEEFKFLIALTEATFPYDSI